MPLKKFLPALRGRESFLIGLLGLLFWALLPGCTSKEQAAVPAGLRIGTTMAIKQTNPVADYYYNILAMLMTHDSLVRFDEELKPVPQLALKFGSDKQARVWTFELAPKARWHDGQPVTPEDVVFTFEYIDKHHVAGAWISDLIEKVETSGNRITFRLKRPYGRFLIDAGFTRILPRHIWQKIEDPYRTQDAGTTVGCGPYRFAGFDQTSGLIRFRSNADYYGQQPRSGLVTFRTYGTMDLLVKDMTRHKIDLFYQYATGIPAPYVDKLIKQPGLACQETVSMGIPAVLGFNLERPIMAIPAVRRAIARAIDYRQMNACLMNGRGSIPSPGLVPPSLPHYADLAPWSQDLKQANTLLASLGFARDDKAGKLKTPEGKPVNLTILVRSDLWGEGQVVKLLARDLEKLGITLKVRTADLATYQAFLKQGDYDLILFRTTPWGMLMHAGGASGYFDSSSAGSLNMCRLKDESYSRLCENILATTDARQLAILNHRMQQYYAEHLPAVALCWGQSVFPHAKAWRGFEINQLEGGLANRFSWAALEAPAPAKVR